MSDLNTHQHDSLVRHGSNIGQPRTRLDGRLKVTGVAKFAADNNPEGMLHAVLAVSTIARGRVRSLDVEAVKALPGIVEVMTPANRPALAQDPDVKPGPMAIVLDVLQNDTVRFANQPIAVVIAETLEAANEGVALLSPQYDVETAQIIMDDGESFAPTAVGPGLPAISSTGDIDAELAGASLRIDSQVQIAPHYHNPMEPHCIVAAFEGEHLSIDMPTQGMMPARGRLAGVLGIPAENIQIRCPFLGGGFGGKGQITGSQVLGVLAARMTGRPVKLVMRREHLFGPVGHRAQTRQDLSIGMDENGTMTALKHHTKTTSSRFDDFFEASGAISRSLYAAPAIYTSHEVVRVDTGTPTFMRAPGDAGGSLALEIAMDDAANAAGMDPLDFRLKNYAEVDPLTGHPFSSKALRECYDEAARRFGWADRPLAPRQMRDSSGLLVGWGMGTAQYPAHVFQAQADAILRRDGTATMKSGLHDMGQGAWTALSQIAADGLALSMDKVTLEYGSTDEPNAGMGGASAHTSTVGMALDAAGREVLTKLSDLATSDQASLLFGAGNVGVIARDGRLYRRDDESRSESYSEIMTRAGVDDITGSGAGGGAHGEHAMFAHGAVFAEVKVDPEIGQIRTTRLVGAFAIGRVINPKMVQSQLNGGMIWGVSLALHEAAAMDKRTGRVMNANLGEYIVPVNADIPEMDAFTVSEEDRYINPLGMKGVGEIAVTGSAGAIANAIWHATGKRVRNFPVSVSDLIS